MPGFNGDSDRSPICSLFIPIIIKPNPGQEEIRHLQQNLFTGYRLRQRIIFIEDLECLLLIVSSQGYFNLSCLYRVGCKR
jgi:hypothetical protein